MNDKKTCSGFPEKAGVCSKPAVATVLRVQVCEEHAKQAEDKGQRVVRHAEKKS
jgi:hypothetical protein